MKEKHRAPAFNRLVVLFNPAGSNVQRARACIDELQTAYPQSLVVAETTPSIAENQKLLVRLLRPGDILLPTGGDGSLNQVLAGLMHPDTPKPICQTRVLAVGTGKMNDVAHMLHGKHFNDPLFVLRHGHELPIYPLVFTATPLDKTKPAESRLGVYNVGFGSIGLGVVRYNDPVFRKRQQKRTPFGRELALFGVACKTWLEASPFEITYKGARKHFLDFFFSSGNTMAGYWRFPSRLHKREFFIGIVPKKSIMQAVRTSVGLFTNTFPEGEVTSGPVTFTLHEPVYAQIDGEIYMPPAPCTVQLGVSEKPITMIAGKSST